MKEFNLDEYLKNPSQKVVTRDGRAVRIICTDFNSDFPIIALVTKGEKEDTQLYFPNGKWTNQRESNLDLFFAPTKREGWVNLYKDEELTFINGDIYDSEEDAKEAIKGDPDFIATIKIEWEE